MCCVFAPNYITPFTVLKEFKYNSLSSMIDLSTHTATTVDRVLDCSIVRNTKEH